MLVENAIFKTKNAKMATLLTIFQLRPRPATSLNHNKHTRYHFHLN